MRPNCFVAIAATLLVTFAAVSEVAAKSDVADAAARGDRAVVQSLIAK